MITERDFSTSFPDFWQELLPLLTPSCVHLLNAGYEEHIIDTKGFPLGELNSNSETRDAAIVSEFAYHLARESFNWKLSVSEAFKDLSIRGAAEAAAFDLITKYEGERTPPATSLNDDELDEGLHLATRYELFLLAQGLPELCSFQFPIKGCGFLRECAADLVLGDYLVEVKTVKRSLAGKDIRQLVVYLALSSGAQVRKWQYAGFFNPRRSTFHKFPVHELIDIMSGGKSVVEVYNELLDFTCTSDVQLDSVF